VLVVVYVMESANPNICTENGNLGIFVRQLLDQDRKNITKLLKLTRRKTGKRTTENQSLGVLYPKDTSNFEKVLNIRR
jgi:hypothetical protein